jgi:hypothetical protein
MISKSQLSFKARALQLLALACEMKVSDKGISGGSSSSDLGPWELSGFI